MSEPFEHAVSNGRRGRHAAPTESRRPDYLADADLSMPAHPADRPDGVNGDGQSHLPGPDGGAAPYPLYGLPAEWARPTRLSPASTQPSLAHPEWDEPAEPAPTTDGPGWQPDWSAQPAHPAQPDWTTLGPEPPRSGSAELVVAERGWPGMVPAAGQLQAPDAHRQPDSGPALHPGTPWDRHVDPDPDGRGQFADHGWNTGSDPAAPGRVARHGAVPADPGWADPAGRYRPEPDRPTGGAEIVARGGTGHATHPGPADPIGEEQRRRLSRLAEAVADLADGCRSLAGDLYTVAGSRHGAAGTQNARTAVEVGRLLDRAAEGADTVRGLLEAARRSLADRPGNTPAAGTPPAAPAGADTAERAAVRHSFDHLVVPESAAPNGSSPHDHRVSSPVPQPREAAMPPELPSTAPSYPPVLPLGLRDGAQAAAVARQVEAARRHLQAALTVGHDVNDPAWRQQLLGMVEQVLAAVAEVATLARDALAPSATDTTFPGEARFLCALPWEQVPVASPERADLPASVNGVAGLLCALGYDARATRTEQGALQVEVRGTRYAVRVVLQQLRLSGTGEWMAYLDWTDGGHPRSGAETLGPAELSDDELARRVDDSLRRRVGPQSG
ncbi:MAG TPA: hypothetical protein VFX70_02190 [Mycobacteriales bacterium]|nr:hypothetical protein [Mycobacteriales bacterium]